MYQYSVIIVSIGSIACYDCVKKKRKRKEKQTLDLFKIQTELLISVSMHGSGNGVEKRAWKGILCLRSKSLSVRFGSAIIIYFNWQFTCTDV